MKHEEINATCPRCSEQLRFVAAALESGFACPKCGRNFVVENTEKPGGPDWMALAWVASSILILSFCWRCDAETARLHTLLESQGMTTREEKIFLPVLAWVILSSWAGLHKGKKLRLQPYSGALLCLWLGPLGWMLIHALRDKRPQCPYCSGRNDEGARCCVHCWNKLAIED